MKYYELRYHLSKHGKLHDLQISFIYINYFFEIVIRMPTQCMFCHYLSCGEKAYLLVKLQPCEECYNLYYTLPTH